MLPTETTAPATTLALTPPDESGVTRLVMPAELIVQNRQQYKQHVLDHLAAGRRVFVLDFKGTGYIDASGLGVLVSIAKKIRDAGGELVLEDLNDDLTCLFELTKIDLLFTIRRTRAEARLR